MDRFVSVVYCDDIRSEVGNKQSLMGIYRQSLYVHEFPAQLAKLCVSITAQTVTSAPFKSLAFRLLRNDETMTEMAIPEDTLANQASTLPMDANADGFLMWNVAFVLAPFQIEAPIKLRVRVIADGEELKGPALVIDKSPDASQPPK